VTLVFFIKFIHLLLTLGLLSSAIYCLIVIGSRQFATRVSSRQNLFRLNKIILILGLFAMLTGTLLVIPKHFTFHTPWIQAAYVLLMIFGLGIASLALLKKKRLFQKDRVISRKERLGWQVAYLILIIILIGIIHDAVTKTTFLF
jgi:hypothetical protein